MAVDVADAEPPRGTAHDESATGSITVDSDGLGYVCFKDPPAAPVGAPPPHDPLERLKEPSKHACVPPVVPVAISGNRGTPVCDKVNTLTPEVFTTSNANVGLAYQFAIREALSKIPTPDAVLPLSFNEIRPVVVAPVP